MDTGDTNMDLALRKLTAMLGERMRERERKKEGGRYRKRQGERENPWSMTTLHFFPEIKE